MRILTVANHLGARGGLERTQLTMCRALAARGHRIDLIYSSAGDFTEDWRDFATSMTKVGGTLPRSQEPFRTSAEVVSAARAARALVPDVIYVFRYLDLPFAAAVGRLVRAAVVLHLCLPQPNQLPFVVRRSLSYVAMTLSVSYDTASLWRNTGLPPDGVIVVHTGIDMTHYVPASADRRAATREALGIDPDAFLALYAGRISPEKGLDVLMQAGRSIAAAHPDFRLLVAGGPSVGTEEDEFERYRSELVGLSGPLDVMWLGAQRDILPLIQTADVAVAPSIWSEPFSRSVIEPLACGIPVIASDVGGNPEILTNWLTRFLVPAGDPDALAERVGGLHAWRSTEPDLGDRCREAVVHRLDLTREVDTVEAALASVAGHEALAPSVT